MRRSDRLAPLRPTVFAALAVAFAASPVLGSDGVASLGSPPPDEDPGAATTAVEDPMDGLLEYAACMREQGIDMPDPQAGGGGFVMEFEGPAGDPENPPLEGSLEDIMGSEFINADQTCSHHLGATVSDYDPALDAEIMEQLLAHADCMREHGVDMPDPVMSGGMISIAMEGPGSSDEARAAQEACRGALPFGEEGLSLTDGG